MWISNTSIQGTTAACPTMCQLRRGLRSIKGASLRLGHFPRHHGQPISGIGPSCNVRARSSQSQRSSVNRAARCHRREVNRSSRDPRPTTIWTTGRAREQRDLDIKTRFQLCLETNVTGPAMVAAAFRPLLLKSQNAYSIYVSKWCEHAGTECCREAHETRGY